jgi:hypothetical protein
LVPFRYNVGLGGGSVQFIAGRDSVREPLLHHEDDGRARESARRDPVLAGDRLEPNDGPTVAFSARLA